MPKQKSNSSAKKRFLVRGSGSIKRAQKNKRHILTKKSTKRKRQLRATTGLKNSKVEKKIRQLILG